MNNESINDMKISNKMKLTTLNDAYALHLKTSTICKNLDLIHSTASCVSLKARAEFYSLYYTMFMRSKPHS